MLFSTGCKKEEINVQEISTSDLVNIINNGEFIKKYKEETGKNNLMATLIDGGIQIDFDNYNRETYYIEEDEENNMTTISASSTVITTPNSKKNDPLLHYRDIFIKYIPLFIIETTHKYEELKPYINQGDFINQFKTTSNNQKDLKNKGCIYNEEENSKFNQKVYNIECRMDETITNYLIDLYNN